MVMYEDAISFKGLAEAFIAHAPNTNPKIDVTYRYELLTSRSVTRTAIGKELATIRKLESATRVVRAFFSLLRSRPP